jgi:hypothetical protein
MNRFNLKRFILDLISFNTPQAKVINLGLILLILAILPTNNLSYSLFKCVFKHFLLPLIFGGICPTSGLFANCACPACGMTRALSSLLHGQINSAWNFNPLVFILLPVMVALIIINLVAWVKYYKKNKTLF